LYQLTTSSMQVALSELAERDEIMRSLYATHGVPPLWKRSQTFATLVHIILEQKVSLTSANAVMSRVQSACPTMQATSFLHIREQVLLDAGLSRSKLSYCQSIAQSILDGQLKLGALRHLSDVDVIEQLTRIKGIGPWTAGVYLMMALRRPDAWASGDRALAVSYQESAELTETPSYAELDKLAESWKPFRATAARLLWHAYLCKRARA